MSGEYNNESNDEGGCSALAWQVGDPMVLCDSGASCHMSHSSTGMMSYRKSNAHLRTASGARYPIEGYGDLPLTFRSSSGDVPQLLRIVAHVPSLDCYCLSLRAVADKGHTYTGNHEGITMFFSTGDNLFFPSEVGRGSAAQDDLPDGRHPQERAARMQGLLNGEGHQDANSLEETRLSI